MRILHVTQIYHPYVEKGGPVVKIRAIAEQLAARGHSVTVLTADLGPRAASPTGPSAEHPPRAEVIYLPTLARYRTSTINPSVIPFCGQRLQEFQIVHIHGLYDLIGPVVGAFCRRTGIPYVLEPTGMYRPKTRSLLKKRIYHQMLGGRLVGGAARLIATSEQERQELVDGGIPAHQTIVRRNGVDLSEFGEAPPRGAFRAVEGIAPDAQLILFLGRLSHIKGLDTLVQAFARMTSNATLVIAGPDDRDGCVDGIRRLIDDLGLHDRVLLRGPIYGRQKIEALTDADVFVLPSTYESYGNVAAEAIACGVPVVVTDRCGIAPLVQDRAGLVVPYDVNALQKALDQVLQDAAVRERLKAGCVALAPALSWEEPMATLGALYSTLLGGSRHSRGEN